MMGMDSNEMKWSEKWKMEEETVTQHMKQLIGMKEKFWCGGL